MKSETLKVKSGRLKAKLQVEGKSGRWKVKLKVTSESESGRGSEKLKVKVKRYFLLLPFAFVIYFLLFTTLLYYLL